MIKRLSTASQESAGVAGYNLQQDRAYLRKSRNMLQAVFSWLFKIISSFFRFRFNELQISFWTVNLYLKTEQKKVRSPFSHIYSQIQLSKNDLLDLYRKHREYEGKKILWGRSLLCNILLKYVGDPLSSWKSLGALSLTFPGKFHPLHFNFIQTVGT